MAADTPKDLSHIHDKNEELSVSVVDIAQGVELREPDTPHPSFKNFQQFLAMQLVRSLLRRRLCLSWWCCCCSSRHVPVPASPLSLLLLLSSSRRC